MKPIPLSREERAILDSESETLLEIIKGMGIEELTSFDHFEALDRRHYDAKQIEWLRKERYLVGAREHHEPSEMELIDDVMRHHNGERFRAYYVMRFPNKVRHKDRLSD